MKTNQNCINCIHCKVCKLKEEYEKYDTFICSHLDKIESNENFDYDLHIRCNEFTVIPDTPNFKDFNRDEIFIDRNPSINYCIGCEYLEKKLSGEGYKFNGPCKWCVKNQFSCTSDTSTSRNKSNSKQILHS